MAADLIVGIDVAGSRRGFHLAMLEPGCQMIKSLEHAKDVQEAVRLLVDLPSRLLIAMDCPPRSVLSGARTRLAERCLCKMGYSVQWTRRHPMRPAEWMVNGERLWQSLRATFPHSTLIETFPTVAARNLKNSEIVLPLALLPDRQKADWKDYLDAAICAEVGNRFLHGKAEFVPNGQELDELGPIYY
ncbi:hypothetical protein BH09SUM1_BH09SUM1_19550 [soil metagenome]